MNKKEVLQVTRDVFGPELCFMIDQGKLDGHKRLVEALEIIETALKD